MGSDAITWQELVRLEPRLEELRRYTAGVKDPGDTPAFCANAIWYGYDADRPYGPDGIRGQVIALVGWHARGQDRRLRTQAAYDLAYQKIYNELPACRGRCGCL